ncbi:hypothetical protein DFP74_4673 [Nocardiopsis sp. Huas11]|nr:hypothetical protein DFP74_4673 [Nocardiopsis sp. Huas11]
MAKIAMCGGMTTESSHLCVAQNRAVLPGTRPGAEGAGGAGAGGSRVTGAAGVSAAPDHRSMPTMSSGRTGACVSARPVASRTAATIAGVDDSVGGSPAPRSP